MKVKVDYYAYDAPVESGTTGFFTSTFSFDEKNAPTDDWGRKNFIRNCIKTFTGLSKITVITAKILKTKVELVVNKFKLWKQ